MADDNISGSNDPAQHDPLQIVLREGARKMLAAAIELEITDFINRYDSLRACLRSSE